MEDASAPCRHHGDPGGQRRGRRSLRMPSGKGGWVKGSEGLFPAQPVTKPAVIMKEQTTRNQTQERDSGSSGAFFPLFPSITNILLINRLPFDDRFTIRSPSGAAGVGGRSILLPGRSRPAARLNGRVTPWNGRVSVRRHTGEGISGEISAAPAGYASLPASMMNPSASTRARSSVSNQPSRKASDVAFWSPR